VHFNYDILRLNNAVTLLIWMSVFFFQNAEKLRKLVTCSEANENTLRLKNREEIFGLFENQEKPFTMKLHLSAKLFDMYIVPLLIEVQVQYLLLKGKDDNLSSSAIRNMIRIKVRSSLIKSLLSI